MSAQIVQIVPRLAPSIGGVGDYASLLAQRLRQDYQIDSTFLVGDPTWQGPARLEQFSIERIDDPQAHRLERHLINLGADLVLLHYVGYGYQKRGCPIWLVEGLKRWRQHNRSRRLVVMFHELFASGRPWQSSFWTSPLQRSLAKSLALLSDHCVTNLSRSAHALAAMTGRAASDFIVLPVFSNVGELPVVHELSARHPTAAIFAGARWLGQLTKKFRALTVESCRRLGIESLISIGGPVGSAPAEFPIPIAEHGYLPAERIRQLLSECRFGLIDYFPGYLAKSGVFAAYAASGVVPLMFCENGSQRDGCVTGANYLIMERLPNQITDRLLQRVADNAMNWYRPHDLAHTARHYAQRLQP